MDFLTLAIFWGGAYFIAFACKRYVRFFAGWNFILLMLLAIVVGSFAWAFVQMIAHWNDPQVWRG